MLNKSGKLATLLFIGVIILPLLGLLIMDYQLKRSNDLTGAYLGSGIAAYASENMLAGAVIIGFVVFLIVTFTINKIRKSRLISTMPLAKIDEEIKKIDERLKGFEEK
jgi:hypothetical protein